MAVQGQAAPDLLAGGQAAERYRRNRRSDLAIWWREIDRSLLVMVLVLMGIGVAAVAAASPAGAQRLGRGDLYFFLLNLTWQIVGLAVLFTASHLSKTTARQAGILIAALSIFLLLLVPVIGAEVNGAKRWIRIGFSLQPAELLKAGYPILLAWILSWRAREPELPVIELSVVLMGLVAMLLMLQPDFGSTMLFAGTWFVLVLLSGISLRRIAAIGAAGAFALSATYLLYDNARHRIDSFLGGGTAFDQVYLAQRTLLNGGFTGTGFWQGNRKFSLPEAHTDYIFSVIGEEFGLLCCAALVIIYFAILLRGLVRLLDEEDLFTVLAGAGLLCQLGGQAFINILVNLQLFPSKGMTLPFVSYGGSSTISQCLCVGLLLAITRRNPFLGGESAARFAAGDRR